MGAEEWGAAVITVSLGTVPVSGEVWNYQPEMLYSCKESSGGRSSECLEDQNVNSSADRETVPHKDSE